MKTTAMMTIPRRIDTLTICQLPSHAKLTDMIMGEVAVIMGWDNIFSGWGNRTRSKMLPTKK